LKYVTWGGVWVLRDRLSGIRGLQLAAHDAQLRSRLAKDASFQWMYSVAADRALAEAKEQQHRWTTLAQQLAKVKADGAAWLED